MKKGIFIVAGVVVFLIVIVAIMFIFSICPPKGPWPTPPWCGKDFTKYTYEVNTNPSSISQIKAVNMYDTWGRNYNMGMVETTQANIEASFERVKKLGAQEIYVHDFDRAIYDGKTDYKSTNYTFTDEIFWNDFRDQSISKDELKKLVDSAHSRGMKIGIKRNIAFVNIGNFILSGIKGNISSDVQKDYEEFNSGHSEEWIRDFFKKWQDRLVEKGKMYQEVGVDSMSISPQFQNPTFAGYEELTNQLWKDLIVELRNNFKGKVIVDLDIYGFVDGKNGNEDWKKYDYYKNADVIEVRVYKILEKYQSSSENAKNDIAKMIGDLDMKAKESGIKISVFFAPSSYKNGLYKGPVEFLDIRNQNIKNLEKDYEEQVKGFESFFNSVRDKSNIERINVGNFAWDDALDPEVRPKVSISAGFRNKPAENIIEAWFLK